MYVLYYGSCGLYYGTEGVLDGLTVSGTIKLALGGWGTQSCKSNSNTINKKAET